MPANSPFIWGRSGEKLTPDQISKRREIEDALLAKGVDTSPVGHWTQGAARVADALAGAFRRGRLDKAEAELGEYQAGKRAKLVELLAGGASAPATSSVPMTSAAGEVAATAPAQVGGIDPSIRTGIVETASALGIDPVDLATAISFETGGTFDPTKSGPTTKWGTHRGLIQFGEPQAAQYGVNWDDPVGSQLGAEGAVAKYLRDAGVQPGMGMLDIYSAINAGRVGRYGASDAAAGGAPGTVSDKVRGMYGHRQKALALLGQGATEAGDTPQAAIEAAPPSGGSLSDEVSEFESTPAYAAQFPGQTVAPSLTPPVDVPAAPTVAPVQVAQSPGINPAIIEALTDPRVDEGSRRIAGILYEQEQARQNAIREDQNWRARQQYEQELLAQDPLRQLQLQKGQLELEQMRNPQPKETDEIREYNFARSQGFEGTFADFKQQMKKAGATNVTTNVGEGDKFYENLDKKNAETFAAMSDSGTQARAKLAQIDRLEGLMANAPQGAVGALKQAAGEWGIPTEGLSDIQAASALLEKMVPEQRAPGTGPMSDADIKMFRASLPRILNQPGGNQLIFQTMRGIAQYEMQMGEIADKVADRLITPAEGRRLIRELKNPLADFKIPEGPTPNEGRKTSTGVQWSID